MIKRDRGFCLRNSYTMTLFHLYFPEANRKERIYILTKSDRETQQYPKDNVCMSFKYYSGIIFRLGNIPWLTLILWVDLTFHILRKVCRNKNWIIISAVPNRSKCFYQ